MEKLKGFSIKNFIWLMLAALMVLTVFLGGYNMYALSVYRKDLVNSSVNAVNLYADNFEKVLRDTEKYCSAKVSQGADYGVLRRKAAAIDAVIASQNLINDFAFKETTSGNVDMFFLYSEINDTYRDYFSLAYSKEMQFKDQVKNHLRAYFKATDNPSVLGWQMMTVAGRVFLFRCFGQNNTYIGAAFELSHISTPTVDGDHQLTSTVVYRFDHNVVYNESFVADNGITFPEEYADYHTTGNRRNAYVVGRNISGTGLDICLIIPNSHLISQSGIILMILTVIFVLALIVIFICWRFIRLSIIEPLEHLTHIMEEIAGGHLEVRDEGVYAVSEFKQMSSTFNMMLEEIRHLKIQSYEMRLEKQKAQLQYLQLQLKPHFFLNCLKNIYGMAQMKKYEKIQAMVLSISNHLRYIFRENLSLVALEEELEYTKNYVRLYNMASVSEVICIIDVSSWLGGCLVPPLVIQTFVENAIKYADSREEHLVIRVCCRQLKTEAGDFLDIMIQDNGNGYAPDILEWLTCQEENIYSDTHVGICNVKNRLRLIFGTAVEIAFRNTEEGALAEIIIPERRRADEADHH